MADALTDPSFYLTVPVATVRMIADLARDLQGKADTTLFYDEAADPDDLELDILGNRGIDTTETKLRTLIDDLSEEAQIDLVAIAWLGRDGGDWPEVRAIAAGRRELPTADYLRSMPLLADYLCEGLAAFEQRRDDAIGGHPV